MSRRIVATDGAPAAIGPYSQGVIAGGFLFTAGQIPLDPRTGQLVEGGIEPQARQALANVLAILAAAGLGERDVVKVTLYLVDLGDYAVVNEVYGRVFDTAPPARSVVQVAALPRGARIEVEAVAALPGGAGSP